MPPRRYIGLTPREREVLELVAQGFTDKEIARMLGRDYITVRDQSQSAVKRLGARNRAHAVALLKTPWDYE